MAGNLFFLPRVVAIDNGAVVPGALLYFYQTGTSTPQDTYTDLALSVPHDNPVVADANGVFDPIYFDPAFGDYRVTLTDSDDVQIWQEDDIPAAEVSDIITLESSAPYIDLVEDDATTNNGVYRIQANSDQLIIRLGNDAKDSFSTVIALDRTLNVLDGFSVNGVEQLPQTGSFTPVFQGFSSDPSGSDTTYTIHGKLVSVRINHGTGTSDDTGFSMTNIPTAIRPSTSIMCPLNNLTDNGVQGWGNVFVDSAGSFNFYFEGTASTWTASGTKGFGSSGLSVFTYPLDLGN